MISLYHGNCLEIMNTIPEHSVDMVLTDPPFGTTFCSWDNIIPFEDMWNKLNRITKDNSAILLFGSEPFSSYLRLSNIKNYRYDLYWVKEKPVNFLQLKRRFGKTTENICVFYKKQCIYNPQKFKSNVKPVTNNAKQKDNTSITCAIGFKNIVKYKDDGTRYPTDILKFNREKLGSTVHPTQKPVDLLEYLIKTYTNKDNTVLDFTMGSGSTGVACIHTGRNFIGIELDKKYYDIACERIRKEEYILVK